MTQRIDGRNIETINNVAQALSSILHLMNSSTTAKTIQFPNNLKAADPTTNLRFSTRMEYLFIEPTTKDRFSFTVPLKPIFGFCFDYDEVIFGYDMELVLIRQDDYFALPRKEDDAVYDLVTEKEKN